MTFGFFTVGSAIAAAGVVTVAALCISWLLRNVVGDAQSARKRRVYSGEANSGAAEFAKKSRRTLYRTDRSPFHVLGFTEVPSSFEEIRAAFLRESNRTHPDLNPDDEIAARRFDLVKKAYEVIGTPQLFASYVRQHPPEEVSLSFDGTEVDVLTVDEFAKRFVSLSAKWQRAESERLSDLEHRMLGNRKRKRLPRLRTFLRKFESRQGVVWIDDVVFCSKEDFPTAKYFKVFDCLIRVDKKESFYRAIRLLLSRNGFTDTFSDVKGHSNSVTIIGDLPGKFIFPKPVKVLISHDDPPARLFTRLWDLGLYRGPKVTRVNYS